ncbi:peptidylprolyl isomerase CPR1 [Sugiyamaella lignohabitans]|uniref:peptidylprolyl isomerase n=1 Tax=Sugiyamaella lignohabitans TaxID=796027 RepID=A0A167FGJ8_9ASCO|nr:peptidylprolyl isomerase CPR1 [Sugiyamaella lignohabitans]ANB15272.1 peptidylprolyl isomerase CPR1 [Sugiyamaella lignohabitans]
MNVDSSMSKRKAEDSSSDSSDDEYGPSLAPATKQKRRRRLKNEKLYLENLPSSQRYSKSFMHKSQITTIVIQPESSRSGIIATGSSDGYLKFWQKTDNEDGIQFVKQFLAHKSAIRKAIFSTDSRLLLTIGGDKTIKIFDVYSLDMINILEVSIVPSNICWIQGRGSGGSLIAVSVENSSSIYIYDIEKSGNQDSEGEVGNVSGQDYKPVRVADKIHKAPVTLLAYNSLYDCVISVDSLGMIEYWQPSGSNMYNKPEGVFEFKGSTNLYDFRKSKASILCLTISPDESKFATFSSERRVAIFDFKSGRKIREYDESLETIEEMHRYGTSVYKPDNGEFARRLTLEKEAMNDITAFSNIIFDESSNFIIYSTLLGIKFVNIDTNTCSNLLGREENIRFMTLSLYQGKASSDYNGSIMTMDMATSNNETISKQFNEDPILFATGFKKNRFYLFSRSKAEYKEIKSSRDVHNETIVIKPSQSAKTNKSEGSKTQLSSTVVLHTSLGDITVRLFPNYAPLAVENFTALCRKGYYDNLIFHRVIKKFMIQGGDPEGDGTGGTSIWGKHFKDEFTPMLRHDRPYTVSMANAGKNTNGSQFFITTEKAPWLDDKHTIFGRVESGIETIKMIEGLKVDKNDRPEDPPSIVSTTVK